VTSDLPLLLSVCFRARPLAAVGRTESVSVWLSATNSGLSQSHGECLLISDEPPFGKATAAFDSSGEPTSFSRALYGGLDSNGDSRGRCLPLEQSVPAPRTIWMETLRRSTQGRFISAHSTLRSRSDEGTALRVDCSPHQRRLAVSCLRQPRRRP
jgi:hypothetical protein